ncbi:unnamed protein product [Cylicocyclus nassatus]|uniref:Exportin-1/Importin-beta-like domain-containing protein n=1 Tax=Cylicocyclus nassatus TaxID=53992 RepID=A0AA36DPV5_CYLNA|nr:unnamed protein product [Cylicocyclus nassatus]
MELADVIEAIRAIHDLSTSNQDRMKFTQVIEELKEGPAENLAQLAFQIIATELSVLRHTGWILLEEIIRFKWNGISSTYRVELRDGLFQAVEALVSEDTIEPCARCVVAMMEHEWPQNWPDLDGRLLEMAREGSLRCAVVFAILRRLVENVATLASIANPRRRKDMHSAISVTANDFASVAIEVLASSPSDHMEILAAKNILGWLAELCGCITSVSLEKQLVRMVDTVICYLGSSEQNICEEAIKCLIELAGSKRDKHSTSITISAFFRSEVLSALLKTISLANEGYQISEQFYRYLKFSCQLVVSLGGLLSKGWTDKSTPPEFEAFLMAVLAFFTHDSLILKYEACDVLLSFSSHAVLRKDPCFMRVICEVLSNTVMAIMKEGCPSQKPFNAKTHFSRLDFDDDSEWHNLFTRFRSRVQLLISENLPVHFNHLLTVYNNTVIMKVILEPNAISDLEWEAMQRFAKNFVQVVYEKNLAERKEKILIEMRDALINKMLSVDDCDILNEMLSLHSPFLPSYVNDDAKLHIYFSLLRRSLVMSSSNKILSRHTVSLILRVVQKFPIYFKLRRALACIQGAVQQVNSSSQLGAMLEPIYPCFFKLARCLLEIHLEHNKALLHHSIREGITEMVASEKEQIYCSVGETHGMVSSGALVVDTDFVAVERQYVHDLNEQIVTIIAAVVAKFPGIIFNLPQIKELLNCLVSNLNFIPEFNLRHWIKKGWKSILEYCPVENFSILESFFVCVADSMQKRLEKMWENISNRVHDSETTEQEVFHEHLTCVVSREYIDFLRSCYLHCDSDSKTNRLSPLGHWLFTNKIGLSPVIMTAFSSLNFPDSPLAVKSAPLCKALAEGLVDCYDDEIGVYMLVSTIRSLQLHGTDEAAGTVLTTLVFHIYCALRRFSNSLLHILMQVPNVTEDMVDIFDDKVQNFTEGDEDFSEKQKRDLVYKLLKDIFTPPLAQQHKKTVYLRPLSLIGKKRRIGLDENADKESLSFQSKSPRMER